VIRLAGSLNMDLVAEGIEDLNVLEWLMDRQIAYFQGHALGCAQPVDELIDGVYRPVPLPSLAGLPRGERGSIALPALLAVVLGLGSAVSSTVAWQQWRIARSHSVQMATASDHLERSYLNLVGLARRSAAADVVQGRTTFAAAKGDVIATHSLDLLNAVDFAQTVDRQSGELERADRLADQAREMYGEREWAQGTAAVIDVVAPAVRRYLDEINGAHSAGGAADDLSRLLYERVALVSQARFAVGLDTINDPRFLALPVLAPTTPDPLMAWMAAPGNAAIFPIEPGSKDALRIAALESIWPHLVNPTRDGIASIDLEQMQADTFALHLAIERHISAHNLPDWTQRTSDRRQVSATTWLITGAAPPAIALLAGAAALVAAVNRRHRSARDRHPAAIVRL
jgi:hypothetical protein